MWDEMSDHFVLYCSLWLSFLKLDDFSKRMLGSSNFEGATWYRWPFRNIKFQQIWARLRYSKYKSVFPIFCFRITLLCMDTKRLQWKQNYAHMNMKRLYELINNFESYLSLGNSFTCYWVDFKSFYVSSMYVRSCIIGHRLKNFRWNKSSWLKTQIKVGKSYHICKYSD